MDFDTELEAIDVRMSKLKPLRRYKVDRHQYKKHAYLAELGLPFCRHLLGRMTVRQQTADATRQEYWISEYLAPHKEVSLKLGLHKLDARLDQGRAERLFHWLSCLEADEISTFVRQAHQGETSATEKNSHKLCIETAWLVYMGRLAI